MLDSDTSSDSDGCGDGENSAPSEQVAWANFRRGAHERQAELMASGKVHKKGEAKAKFDASVFWSTKEAQQLFPQRAVVFKSYLSAINHEATSERTFSYAGRVFTKGRSDMGDKALCDQVVVQSGSKKFPATSAEVKGKYKDALEIEKKSKKARVGGS